MCGSSAPPGEGTSTHDTRETEGPSSRGDILCNGFPAPHGPKPGGRTIFERRGGEQNTTGLQLAAHFRDSPGEIVGVGLGFWSKVESNGIFVPDRGMRRGVKGIGQSTSQKSQKS